MCKTYLNVSTVRRSIRQNVHYIEYRKLRNDNIQRISGDRSIRPIIVHRIHVNLLRVTQSSDRRRTQDLIDKKNFKVSLYAADKCPVTIFCFVVSKHFT